MAKDVAPFGPLNGVSDVHKAVHPDKVLADRVARGDARAFDDFFDAYFPRLYRFAMARLDGDHAVAEEVVQQTLCRVMHRLDSYRGEASLFTWLCQICRNELSAYFKRSADGNRNESIEGNPAVMAALESLSALDNEVESARSEQEIGRFVQLTLDYLPVKYATALEMKYILGSSVEEIAERLQLSTKAAESTLSRARQAFKDGFQTLWGADAGRLLDW